MRYHGGKWRLARWVISHFPPHRIYVEPFGGAASVLMQKPRTYAEVYNDLDDEVVGVFRVLRDPVAAERLEHLLSLTPFARVEFEEAYAPAEDAVEQARRTIIKAFMAYGSNGIQAGHPRGMRTSASTWGVDTCGFKAVNKYPPKVDVSGFNPKGGPVYANKPNAFRPRCVRSGSSHATDWAKYPQQVRMFCERLAGVVIEHRPALEVIAQHDRPDTLFYVDPPYLHDTRNRRDRHGYRHEMSDDDHRALSEVLHQAQGMVILSGYPHPLYDELYAGWRRVEHDAMADGAHARVECLWINPAAGQLQGRLFGEGV
ncbi:MAG: DNA adenine methylase [Armatimonadota bacterium]